MRVDGAANPDLIHQSGERPDLVADVATPHVPATAREEGRSLTLDEALETALR